MWKWKRSWRGKWTRGAEVGGRLPPWSRLGVIVVMLSRVGMVR